MSSYDVGQIIYVVSSQKMQVLPFVIAEEVVRKTLDGQEVTYLVKSDKTKKVYNLDELKGTIYLDIDDVRSALVENATRAIDKICALADAKGQGLSPKPPPQPAKPAKTAKPQSSPVQIPSDEDLKSFVLEDGTRVHVNSNDI